MSIAVTSKKPFVTAAKKKAIRSALQYTLKGEPRIKGFECDEKYCHNLKLLTAQTRLDQKTLMLKALDILFVIYGEQLEQAKDILDEQK